MVRDARRGAKQIRRPAAPRTLPGRAVTVYPAMLTLHLSTIDTARGSASIDAAIRSTEHTLYNAPGAVFYPEASMHRNYLFPQVEPEEHAPSPGDVGPHAYGYYNRPPGPALNLPVGAEMRLVLTRPLATPAVVTPAAPQ